MAFSLGSSILSPGQHTPALAVVPAGRRKAATSTKFPKDGVPRVEVPRQWNLPIRQPRYFPNNRSGQLLVWHKPPLALSGLDADHCRNVLLTGCAKQAKSP